MNKRLNRMEMDMEETKEPKAQDVESTGHPCRR